MCPDLGRRRHYRDFYRPAPPPDDRPLWLIWGNCQAEALRQVLDAVPDRPYRTARIPPVHELQVSDLPYLEALLAHTAVLLSQPVRCGYRGLPIGTNDLTAKLRHGAEVRRWPVIRYAGLYPFQAIARLPADRSITPPGVPYHDLRTIAAARAGRSADEPWDVDLSDDQIRAVAAASCAELARRERGTDVGVADVIATFGADAAHTINHPGNTVLYELGSRLLESCGVPATPVASSRTLLDSAWAPLEPRVIAALGIEATPRAGWRLDGVHMDSQDVHAIQMAWYREHPEFIDVTVQRHGAVMQTLGLLS